MKIKFSVGVFFVFATFLSLSYYFFFHETNSDSSGNLSTHVNVKNRTSARSEPHSEKRSLNISGRVNEFKKLEGNPIEQLEAFINAKDLREFYLELGPSVVKSYLQNVSTDEELKKQYNAIFDITENLALYNWMQEDVLRLHGPTAVIENMKDLDFFYLDGAVFGGLVARLILENRTTDLNFLVNNQSLSLDSGFSGEFGGRYFLEYMKNNGQYSFAQSLDILEKTHYSWAKRFLEDIVTFEVKQLRREGSPVASISEKEFDEFTDYMKRNGEKYNNMSNVERDLLLEKIKECVVPLRSER